MKEINDFSQLGQIEDRPTEKVSIEAWGVDIYLRAMSSDESENIVKEFGLENGLDEEASFDIAAYRERVIRACWVKSNGEPLITTAEEYKEFNRKSTKAVTEIFNACTKMNRLTGAEHEEDVKNSSETQTNGSGLS